MHGGFDGTSKNTVTAERHRSPRIGYAAETMPGARAPSRMKVE